MLSKFVCLVNKKYLITEIRAVCNVINGQSSGQQFAMTDRTRSMEQTIL